MGVKNYLNEKIKVKVNIKTYPKYDDYNYPVILLDSDLDIIYKNDAARFVNIKPRVGMNMQRYTDEKNLEKLRDILVNEKINIIMLNVQSHIKYCTARKEKAEKYEGLEKLEKEHTIIVLIFFDSLNFLREDKEVIEKITTVIAKYNEQEKVLINSINPRNADNLNSSGSLRNAADMYREEFAESAREDIDYIEYIGIGGEYPGYEHYENNKKILRIREHFRRHILNLKKDAPDIYKNYCDIGEFMRNFEDGISSCINSLGYKMNFSTEDNMFMYKLNKRDFLTVNFILASFSFEHSVFDKINVKFFTDIDMAGVLRYEFSVPGDFGRTHRDIFEEDYPGHIGGVEHLDLVLAHLIAQNNDLRLKMRLDEDIGSKVCIDLIFGARSEILLSPPPADKNYVDIITVDFIRDKAEIEFSMLLPSAEND